MSPNVFTIAAGLPFARTLAHGLIETSDIARNPLALADTTIYLPTRRAVRTLGETFARILGGAALLPNLQPLGDIDEDEVFFDASAEDFELAPAMPPLRRRLLLSTLVAGWQRAKGGDGDFAEAVLFARALGHFLDEAATQEADLSQLESLAPASLAEHWTDVRDFLALLRGEWPKILEAEGRLEPAARRAQLLDAKAAQYRATSPDARVIAAGTTGSIPATARLLATIARMPNGAVILPGLDRALDDESWEKLDPGHPQFGMKELLARLGVAREDVRDWAAAPASLLSRATVLRETLRPAPTTDAWRAIADTGASDDIARGLAGLSLIEAAHPGEEALAIALILRETLETAGKTAALVTPDRNLARRVAAELGRWQIAIDDSAGKPLSSTPPGAFLLLLAEAVAEDFAPVPLLALLKHPLSACGMRPEDFRRLSRVLDKQCLRGPRPDPGFAGLKEATAQCSDALARDLRAWLEKIESRLSPLVAVFAKDEAPIAEIAAAHVEAAEAFAESRERYGDARLWQGDAGTSAAELMAALQTESQELPSVAPRSYTQFLRTLMDERAVRPAYGRHPRLAILGPLEARLRHFDVIVLGGLNEGTWPQATAADPWLSRPMRAALGLASPERAIGLAAHDFAMLAAGARVHLTRSLKVDGTPTVASRWLQRLLQLVSGLGLRTPLTSARPYAGWAASLEVPQRYAPEDRPEPKPPVAKRPRSLSVTEVETWLRDPYAIYAKHVLRLKPLEPLDAEVGALERGNAIHKVLELFLKEGGTSDARILEIADVVFTAMGIPHAARALWRPRLAKAARWFIRLEKSRESTIARSFIEIKGQLAVASIGGEFVLRGRADRIDVLTKGGGVIIDYKTGNPPTPVQVADLIAPQLPLEGAMLANGGFADVGALRPHQLLYIKFSGSAEAGKLIPIDDVGDLVAEEEDRLRERVARFDLEDTAYLPRVMPFRKDIPGEYDHLARVLEWSSAGWEEDELP